MPSDSQFVERLAAHRQWIAGIAIRMGIHAYDDREDIVQDATMRAWLHRHTLQGDTEAQFKGWLCAIVRNLCCKFHTCPRARAEVKDEVMFGALACSDPAPAQLDLELFLRRLAEVLPRLSHQHRTLILASMLENSSYEDMAAMLACNVGTVRSALYRARSRVRELLGEDIYSVCARPEIPSTYVAIDQPFSRPHSFEASDQERIAQEA